MSESNERKFKCPVGSLVNVVKKGETSWSIQSRFLDRPGIVIGHEFVFDNNEWDGEWSLNEVLFDDGDRATFYDVELIRIS